METKRSDRKNALRNMSTSELWDAYEEAKKSLFNLRYRSVSSKIEDPSMIKWTKKEIARILTLINERLPVMKMMEERKKQEETSDNAEKN